MCCFIRYHLEHFCFHHSKRSHRLPNTRSSTNCHTRNYILQHSHSSFIHNAVSTFVLKSRVLSPFLLQFLHSPCNHFSVVCISRVSYESFYFTQIEYLFYSEYLFHFLQHFTQQLKQTVYYYSLPLQIEFPANLFLLQTFRVLCMLYPTYFRMDINQTSSPA